MPLYAQGYSLCRFLIEQRDRKTFIRFLSEGLQGNQWNAALNNHYGVNDLAQLQSSWLDWVRAGSPINRQAPEQNGGQTLVASNNTPKSKPNAYATPRPSAATPAPGDVAQAAVAAAPAAKLVPIRKPSADELLAAAEPHPEQQVDLSPIPGAEARSPETRAVQPVQLTRPQPAQQAQGRVLEWAQPAPGAQSPSVAPSPAPAALAATTGSAAAASKSRIKLSSSAAQRYLPAAMSRPRPKPTEVRPSPNSQASAAVTTGEI
jgi:hypothetical protein